jgi:superfamily II DNA/RNA helicase
MSLLLCSFRLFEMGFAEQLTEIIRRLPDNRQSLLFSATLPKLLVEFARAGETHHSCRAEPPSTKCK